MVARGRGQIAVISSLAGFAAWPGAPAYSASKAAVRVYAEALHGALAHSGVTVTAVCPGFIETPMTAVNGYKMPFMMRPDRAADLIVRGLAAGRPRLCFPLRTYVFAALPGFLPAVLSVYLLGRLPAKPACTNTL
jgi:short-subunit dehydrogenase